MAVWINPSGGTTWVPATPSVSTGTVYRPADKVYRYTGSAWQEVWARTLTPPNAPTVTATIQSGTRNVVEVKVTVPSYQPGTNYARCVVKVGVNKQPTGPETNDGCYYATTVAGEKWSEWFTDQRPNITKGASRTKVFPGTGMGITLPLDTPIYVRAYLQDQYNQWSSAGSATVRTLKAATTTTTPPTTTTQVQQKPINVQASWFGSYLDNNAPYAYHDNLGQAVQGDTPYDNYGLLRSLIGFPEFTWYTAGSTITEARFYVYMKHWHYSTGGVLSVGLHQHKSKPGSFSHNASSVATMRYTYRGQGLWVYIPSQYFPGIANGTYRGISLYRQSADPTYYGYADAMQTICHIEYKK